MVKAQTLNTQIDYYTRAPCLQLSLAAENLGPGFSSLPGPEGISINQGINNRQNTQAQAQKHTHTVKLTSVQSDCKTG